MQMIQKHPLLFQSHQNHFRLPEVTLSQNQRGTVWWDVREYLSSNPNQTPSNKATTSHCVKSYTTNNVGTMYKGSGDKQRGCVCDFRKIGKTTVYSQMNKKHLGGVPRQDDIIP